MLAGFGDKVPIVLAKSARDLRSRALRTRRAACTFAPGEIKERGRNNFPNYPSQLQAIFAQFKSTKILK